MRSEIELGPHLVALTRYAGFAGRHVQRLEQPLAADGHDAAHWRHALDALAELLRASNVASKASVALSSHWVHVVVVPLRPELRSETERLEFARHLFVARFGPQAEHWLVRLTGSARGTMLACAVDAALVGELVALCFRHRLAARSVEPLAWVRFNRHAARVKSDPCWVLIPESGTVFVGLVRAGGWASAGVRRLADATAESLAALLDTEHQLQGIEPAVVNAVIIGSAPLARNATGAYQWECHAL